MDEHDAYGCPSRAQGSRNIGGWEFTSAFDGGNALCSSWKREEPEERAVPGAPAAPVAPKADGIPTFSVEIARDCHGDPFQKAKAFWFHFGVTPPEKFVGEIKIIVHGMCEQRDLYATGYRPWVGRPAKQRWQRLPPEADVEMGQSSVFGWQCAWKYKFDGAPGETRFAFCHPYGYGELLAWLDRLDADFSAERRPKPGAAGVAAVPKRAKAGRCRADRAAQQEDFLRKFELTPNGDTSLDHLEQSTGASASSSSASSEDEPDIRAPSASSSCRENTEVYYFASRHWHDDVRRAGEGIYYHRQTVARSPKGRMVNVITVTEDVPAAGKDWPREEMPETVLTALRQNGVDTAVGQLYDEPPLRFPGRPYCFFSGRVHPGETPGQFAVNGFLQFILSDDPRAAHLRRKFVFKVCPMLNPDGVAWGHSRTSAVGFDLNRCYRNPTMEQHEAIYTVKHMLMAWAARRELLFYMDSHGHAARRGCFLFGNHHGPQAWSSEDALLWNLAYVHAAQLNSPHIDIDACEWSRAVEASKGKSSRGNDEEEHDADETSRSDSGRAQIGASCRLYHAYTLECNYNISRSVRPVPNAPGLSAETQSAQALVGGEALDGASKRPKPMPYTPREWAAVGEALAVALLDLHGLNPHSRLIGAMPPRPLLPPDKDLSLVSLGLDRLFSALAERHRSVAALPTSAPPRPLKDGELANGAPPRAQSADLEATCKQWLVMEPVVWVVPKADPTQSSKDKVAAKKRGDVVEGSSELVDGHRWLRTQHEGADAWILVDGRAAGVGRNFLMPVEEDTFLRRRVFKVVHDPHVYLRSLARKDGNALGIKRKGETVVVQEVRSDGWVQLDPSELAKNPRKNCNEAYMLVDGKAVGLGQLMVDTCEQVKVPSALYTDGGLPAQVAPWVEHVERGHYPAPAPSLCD
mmetsp:Transcript_81986/g.232417  ORF Transcript_81986/g.232417 Transcript_81986/m.232417 type:complete len:920 (-) Transcript_81986:37-2796(-)